MKYVLMLTAVLLLSACGDDKAETTAQQSAKQRAENPLLKLQDDTTQKAENVVNSAANKQQEALGSIGQ